jgi:hypothetical protein
VIVMVIVELPASHDDVRIVPVQRRKRKGPEHRCPGPSCA